MVDKKKPNNRIYLGHPLDILLNRDCKYSDYVKYVNTQLSDKENFKEKYGGLTFPEGSPDSHLWSGNIVIQGSPGTGKSTLAMQIAVSCAIGNHSAIYLSFEEHVNTVIDKSELFGWKEHLCPITLLHNPENSDSPQQLANDLGEIFKNSDNCENKNVSKVLLPSLSPRSIIDNDDESNSDLFWKRYKQIQDLLVASKFFNEPDDPKNTDKYKNVPKIKLFCIDSLNVFGNKPLSRVELFRIFDLFKRYKTIGVFIIEDDFGNLKNNSYQIEYLADIVISLSSEYENGYYVRYLETLKSRYQHQIYGKHPFKISKDENKIKIQVEKSLKQAVHIYPSLHYIVSATENKFNDAQNNDTKNKSVIKWDEIIGIDGIKSLLPDKKFPLVQVITIEGPRSTFKSTMAYNFLLKGIGNEVSGLLISLNDTPKISLKSRIGFDIKNHPFKNRLEDIHKENGAVSELFKRPEDSLSNKKIVVQKIGLENDKNLIYEQAFQTGMLLPEEFIFEVERILNIDPKIEYVVLDDISAIDVSYPLLKQSKNSSDLFLPCFVHLMRNRGKKLIMIGTTGEYKESDESVKKAKALSDTVISSDVINIFGEQHIIIKGEGLRGSDDNAITEPVPGIIKKTKEGDFNRFAIDHSYLRGLIGFDTKKIKRPKLLLQLFEENEPLHINYNLEIKNLLKSALGEDTEFSVVPIQPKESEAFHSSINILSEKPVEKTIIISVDEFLDVTSEKTKKNFVNINEIFKTEEIKEDNKEASKEKLSGEFMKENYITSMYDKIFIEEKKETYFLPYYCNVLLLAYKNIDKNNDKNNFDSWVGISDYLKTHPKVELICDTSPKETLACVFLDALFSANHKEEKDKEEKDKKEIDKKEYKQFIDDIFSAGSFDNAISEFNAFRTIFKKAKFYSKNFDENTELTKKRKELLTKKRKELLSKDFIFLGWYSQLRSLIEDDPKLANNVEIGALPGRGFTGDWFIGIRNGSVSKNLGMDVIKALCKTSEEYKRFVRGVGLPTRKIFYNQAIDDEEKRIEPNFYSWPNADHNQKLKDLYQIHANAFSRSWIDNYQELRATLYTIFQQICDLNEESIRNKIDKRNKSDIQINKEVEIEINEQIKQIVERLKSQYKMFRKIKI